MDLYKDYLGNAGFIQIIKRGTGEILEESDSGIFLYDTLSEIYLLKNDSFTEGASWVKKHKDRAYEIMVVYDDALSDFVKEYCGFTEEEKCYQGVWTKPEPSERKNILDFRPATMDDVPFLKEHYEDWYDEAELKIIERGELFIAMLPEDPETKVGFIGMHLEGATGLLCVLPGYRNRGYAAEMESFMCEWAMSQGLISYGHVKVGNEKSMNLQKKVGVDFWEGTLTWLFKVE